METLLVRLTDDASTGQWVIVDANGRLVSQPAIGALHDAAILSRGRYLAVLVPGREVLLSTVDIPQAGRTRLGKMVPFALEDALADDIGQLFFATGRRQGTGQIPVAIVANGQMDRWMSALAAAELVPQTVLIETQGVPDIPATLSLYIEGPRIHARAPGQTPITFDGLDPVNIAGLLEINDSDPACAHLVVRMDPPAATLHEAALEQLATRFATADIKTLAEPTWCALASIITQRPGINLLQGRYAPHASWVERLRPWRAAACLLLAVVIVAITGRVASYLSLQHQDDVLGPQLAQVCQVRAGTRRLTRCADTVRQQLAVLRVHQGARGGFLDGLAIIVASTPTLTHMKALDYNSGIINISMVSPDVSSLNTLVQAVNASSRFDARIESTTPVDDTVEGRVQITRTSQ